MGSSGGSYSFGEDDIKKIEQIARDALTEVAEPGKRCVYISFASEELNEVNLLRGQAKNENSALEFIDWSLKKPFDSKDAEYIKRGIRERIKQSSVSICYLSDNAAKSKWVDWEIRESIKLGKGVIAMHKGDSPPRNLPPAIKVFKIEIVPWSQEEITNAINRAAKERD